jgi:branched-chain amino acid aminotransferase
MLARRKVWIDGRLAPFNSARVHIMSHSFCRGSAIFEVMCLDDTDLGPAVFRLDDHLQRLQSSAQHIRMKLPFSARGLKEAVLATVKANRLASGMVKLMAFYGEVEFEVIPRNPKVTVAVVAVDQTADLAGERFRRESRQPAEVCISPWRKPDPRTVPVECKCAASYIGGMIAKLDGIAAGYSTPILLDLKGLVAEGATESVFMVKKRVLSTPALGNILAGITRRTILEVARDLGIETRETKLRPRDLLTADEIFFTSSVSKIWPVARLEQKRFQAPGELTRLLEKVLDKVHEGKVKRYRKWLSVAK